MWRSWLSSNRQILNLKQQLKHIDDIRASTDSLMGASKDSHQSQWPFLLTISFCKDTQYQFAALPELPIVKETTGLL